MQQTTTWEASVEKARLASLKTFEGRLETARASFEQFPPKGKGVPRGKTLAHFAAEAGIEYQTLANYRDTAAWWGDLTPQGKISWTAAREAKTSGKWKNGAAFVAMVESNDPPEGFTGWTVDALRVHLGNKPTNTGKLALKMIEGEKVTEDDMHVASAEDAGEAAAAEIEQVKDALAKAEAARKVREQASKVDGLDHLNDQTEAIHRAIEGPDKIISKIAFLVTDLETALGEVPDYLERRGSVKHLDETGAEILLDVLASQQARLDHAFNKARGVDSIEAGFESLLANEGSM